QALSVVLQHSTRFGQGAVLRRAIEQLLAEADLQPPDGLTDGRLRAIHLLRRARKTALLGDREKDAEFRQIHGSGRRWHHNTLLLFGNDYHFDFYSRRRLQLTA